MTISEEVKKITLKGFEGLDLSKILYMPSEFDRIYPEKKKHVLIDYFLLIIKVFIQKYKYIKHTSGSSKILFLCAHDTNRKDIYSFFFKLANLVKDSHKINGSFYNRINIKYGLIGIYHLISWYKILSNTTLNNSQKLKIFTHLIEILKFQLDTKDIIVSQYNLLVVVFDAAPLYNYYVQVFKKNHIVTATLPHGVILAERKVENNIDFAGVELKNCISDYLLAWNKFTEREAIASGISKNRIKVTGIARCIDSKSKSKKETKTFGVILDGVYSEENNLELIKFANQIAERLNYKYVLKYHPMYKSNIYQQSIDSRYIKEISFTIGEIENFTNEVDFSILANSTALFELVFIKHEVYCLHSNKESDKFKSLNTNNFATLNEFFEKYNSNKNEMQKNLFEDLCTIQNIKETYKKFFNSFEN